MCENTSSSPLVYAIYLKIIFLSRVNKPTPQNKYIVELIKHVVVKYMTRQYKARSRKGKHAALRFTSIQHIKSYTQ